jgi:2-dehydro-3-deoxyphosphogluconate aldolase/(4S)-4-hydroxy-2-oxoglutarate aldolase
MTPSVPKADVLSRLRAGVIVPVIRAGSSEAALAIAGALVEGGIRTLEITMTVPDALATIAAVATRFGSSALLGAGTVTTGAMAAQAIDAGACFLVTPAVVPDVIAVARDRQVAVLPGALTPTEVLAAWTAGGDIIKVFPASAVGGASYLRALKGPFPDIPLCPTGGVNLETIGEFLTAGADAVGVGGELVLKAAVARGDYAAITDMARRYVAAAAAART